MNQTNSKFYLGIDLNDHYAMISYFNTEMPEPQTASVIAGSEDYLIPVSYTHLEQRLILYTDVVRKNFRPVKKKYIMQKKKE